MKIFHPLIIISLFVSGFALPATAEQPSSAVRQVVLDMNQAVNDKDINKMLALFDQGSVRIDLFPAHNYADKPPVKTDIPVTVSDLPQRWQTVAALLFNTAKSYSRQAKDIQVQVDGDMATAWVNIETSMVAKDPSIKSRSNSFVEALLLRRQNATWKIVAVSNNRSDQ